MPTGHDFSRETKQMMFNVIKFVEREKGGCIIPLNNVNDRIHSILGISMTSVERLKREMREQEREMLEKENELIQLQKKRDQRRFELLSDFEIHAPDHHLQRHHLRQLLLHSVRLQQHLCLLLNRHGNVVNLVVLLSF